MTMDTRLFFLFEILVFLVGLLIVTLFSFFYLRLLSGYRKLSKDREKLKKELEIYASRIEERSKEHIGALIAHSKHMSEDLKKELTALLSSQADREADAYTQVLSDVGKSVQAQSSKQVQTLVAGFGKELHESQEELSAKVHEIIATAYTQAEQIRSEAKSDAKNMIDRVHTQLATDIYAIVQEVVTASVGKLLRREDHDGIVIGQLEETFKRLQEKSDIV